MILGVFLACCAAGALLGIVHRSPDRYGQLTGIVFAAAAVAAAAALSTGSGADLTLGGVELAATPYASAFLAVTAAACLLLCLVGAATQPPADLAPAALAAFGGFGVAMTSTDPRVALFAGAAAATTGTMTLVHRPNSGEPDGRMAEMRILGVVVAALLLAAAVVLRPPWNGHEDRAIGLAFLALILAVAVRAGVVPFHVPAAHLSRNATPTATALLLVWLPAVLAALALTWSPLAFGVGDDWVTDGIGLVQVVAVATILLGGLAALVHDEIDEVVAYSIVSDAGLILLALASRTEVAAEPARVWLLTFVAAKTALVAWAAAISRVFGATDVAALRGWLRRTPLLGAGLAAVAVATLGWPGSGVAGARSELIRLGLPSGLGWVGIAAVVLSVGYHGRLLVIGALPAGTAVRDSWSEWPRLGFAVRATALEAATETGASATRPADAPPKRKRRARTAAAAEPQPSVTAEPPASSEEASSEEASSEEASSEEASSEEAEPEGGRADGGEPPHADAKSKPARKAVAPDAKAAAPATDPAAETAELKMPRRRPSGPSIGHRLALMWRLNRTLEVSLVVVASAVLSLAVAAGSFGVADAARDGIPLGTAAHATASPTPVPSLPPTQAPLATGTPIPSPSPSPSPGPSGPSPSPGASVTPPPQATPVIK